MRAWIEKTIQHWIRETTLNARGHDAHFNVVFRKVIEDGPIAYQCHVEIFDQENFWLGTQRALEPEKAFELCMQYLLSVYRYGESAIFDTGYAKNGLSSQKEIHLKEIQMKRAS